MRSWTRRRTFRSYGVNACVDDVATLQSHVGCDSSVVSENFLLVSSIVGRKAGEENNGRWYDVVEETSGANPVARMGTPGARSADSGGS